MTAKIIQGEDRTLNCFIKDESANAFDLTGVTEITAKFEGTSSTITVTLTGAEIAIVSPAGGGNITIELNDTNTALLAKGVKSFQVEVDKGAEKRIVKYLQQLTVEESLF